VWVVQRHELHALGEGRRRCLERLEELDEETPVFGEVPPDLAYPIPSRQLGGEELAERRVKIFWGRLAPERRGREIGAHGVAG
jgi:hypothetical protein